MSEESKTTPKSKLIIDQGMVRLTNNAPSGEYLREWQMNHGHPNGTEIRIVTRAHFEDMVARAQMAGIA